MTNFGALLRRLAGARVDFVLIGGLAVLAHGHVRATLDLDVCYARTSENYRRLVAALEPIHPRIRGAPESLPFFFDERTLLNGLNFTLTTDEGDLDLLGEVTGIGTFDDVAPRAVTIDAYDVELKMISLDDLIRAKAAAGRAKDLIDLEALRALKNRRPA